jgi:hypothetical protein
VVVSMEVSGESCLTIIRKSVQELIPQEFLAEVPWMMPSCLDDGMLLG